MKITPKIRYYQVFSWKRKYCHGSTTSERKENTKSIKVTEKITHVRDSVNEKGLSTDKFTSIFRDIPRVTSDDMVHHAISFAEKNPKKLIVHAGINNIYSNKEITANCKKKNAIM